jgi:hypothetical protein
MGKIIVVRPRVRAPLALLLAVSALPMGRSHWRDPCTDRQDCVSPHKDDSLADTVRAVMHSNQSETEEETWYLLSLNDFVRPEYHGRQTGTVLRSIFDAEFYITKLPDVGQLFQAYRPAVMQCDRFFPQSCATTCCSTRPRTTILPNGVQLMSCCHARSDEEYGGQRLFLIGDEITTVPAKVDDVVMRVMGAAAQPLLISRHRHIAVAEPRRCRVITP